MTIHDLVDIIAETRQSRSWTASAHRPAWPTVIGIIALALGGLGVLGGLWGVIRPLTAGWMSADVPPGERATFEVSQQWRAWTIPLALVSAGVAAGLVVAGFKLLTRHVQARRMCMIWAAAKLALVLAATVVNYRIAKQIVAVTVEQSTHAPRIASIAGRQFAEMGTTVELSLGVVWGIALPVFLLIWFMRARIRDEVARWG